MNNHSLELQNQIEANQEALKINVGAGGTNYVGWISLEKDDLDITKAEDWSRYFHNYKISNILMEHVAEHLYYEDFVRFMLIVKPHLRPAAVIRVAVPDANHPSGYVRELTKVNGTDPGADDHKYFYKLNDMQIIAANTGYSLEAVEYFTDNGVFVSNNPSFERGYISRCSKNYTGRFTSSREECRKMIDTVPEPLQKQFFQLGISYTSLWVDFINQ